jgi:ribosomal protein L37AE/L43A
MSITTYEIIAHLAEQCHDLAVDNRLMVAERERFRRAFISTNPTTQCPNCPTEQTAVLQAEDGDVWKCRKCGLKIHISAVIHAALEERDNQC